MPARFFAVIAFVLVSLGCASQVSADFFFGMFNGLAKDVKRRNCWPEPFITADRGAARAPFATMVSNGWRRQNMLGESHFDPTSGQLTEAGRIKVRWILTNAPQQHRIVYVHAANNEADTSVRLAAVKVFASQVTPTSLPPVFATTIADEGWPAAEVDALNRKYFGSLPTPRLAPAATGGATSGGGAFGN